MSALHDSLAAAAQRATPGPWLLGRNGKSGAASFFVWRNDHIGGLSPEGRNEGYVRVANHVYREADARLIALAPLLPEVAAALEPFALVAEIEDTEAAAVGMKPPSDALLLNVSLGQCRAAARILASLSAVASADGAGEAKRG